MGRAVGFAVALTAALLSVPAHAESWFCNFMESTDGGRYRAVATRTTFDVAPGQVQQAGYASNSVQAEFEQYLKTALGIARISNYYTCASIDPAAWKSRIDGWKKAGNIDLTLIDWSPQGSSRAATGPAGFTSTGGVEIQQVKRPIQEGWDEALREQLRRDAAGKAKSIAATAREEAKNQAEMTRLFAEMRKRGSAQ
jgi:hypothetical protein